ERLGRFLKRNGAGLADFFQDLNAIASRSPLSELIPRRFPSYHISFASLFDSVRTSRNSAVHEGAAARHLTTHALELALILEDALMPVRPTVAERMIRGPVVAARWQPVSFVRQALLANSFSYLPIEAAVQGEERWYLVSDVAVATFLNGADSAAERNRRLQT